MTIESIEEVLKVGQNSPHELADMRAFLSSAYSYHTGELQEILSKKPMKWNELRVAQKSDKATERAWEATEDGIQEVQLRYTLKRCEMLIRATSSLLRVAEGEAKNQY